MTVDREGLAYCAGLYEGEGSVFTASCTNGSSNKIYYRIILAIGMTDLEPLIEFKDVVRIGNINGPYAGKGSRKSVYRYTANGFENVQYIIAMLWPWLSSRRKEQSVNAFNAIADDLRGSKLHLIRPGNDNWRRPME